MKVLIATDDGEMLAMVRPDVIKYEHENGRVEIIPDTVDDFAKRVADLVRHEWNVIVKKGGNP